MKKIILLLCATAITGCAAQAEKPAAPAKIGMPNPASAWCIKQGGKLDIVNSDKGQVGYCTLPGGERVEEWTLYRRDH
ncbi:putative hemolysin [Erwinia amylovora]